MTIAQTATSNSSHRFNLVPWSELQFVEAQWLVDSLIPANGISAMFGTSGSGKSFLSLDLAASIGSGLPFFGKKVVEGDVIYIAGEGASGLKNRTEAMQKAKSISSPRVHFLTCQLDLRSNENDRESLIAEIQSLRIKPVLIIIDTLARAFAGGNENGSDDMGKFIIHVTALQQTLNTAVLIVHHSGKDEARGQRGHSSLKGAIDAEIEVHRLSELGDKHRYGQMTVTKQKDGEDGVYFYFKLDVVQLDSERSPRSSLVVLPIDEFSIQSSSRRKPISGHQKTAFDALKKAINESGEVRTLPDIPSDRRSVPIMLWRETFYMMAPSDHGQKSDSKQKAFKRSSANLIHNRTVGHWADYVWIADC